jgi:hypothetical protein
MSTRVTAEKGKKMLHRSDWEWLLIMPFDFKEKVQDAVSKVERWIQEEEADWFERDDFSNEKYVDAADGEGLSLRDGAQSSYLIIGCYESRIQGPALYVLIAGATDYVDISVKTWNKRHEEKCIRISFQAFGQQRFRRRQAMLIFLRGLFDVGCLAVARVYKNHRISEQLL